MRMMRLGVSVLGVYSMLAVAEHARGADRVATDAELQTMFEQKQYKACLQQSARIMQLKGDAAKPYDLYVIHMRRAECYLAQDDMATAQIAYNAALSAATSAPQADQALAMIALLKASRGHDFVPRAPGSKPLNIVAADTRKDAINALFAQRFADSSKDLKAAAEAPTLTPIIKIVPQAREIHALELVGTGKEEQTMPVMLAIGEHARDLINGELIALNTQLDAIEKRAYTPVASGNTVVDITNNGVSSSWFASDSRLGLQPNDRDRLRSMIPYLSDIAATCDEARNTALRFGRDGQVWKPVIADSQTVLRRAQAILDGE